MSAKKSYPISVQLYTLREASKEDFDAVLQKLSLIGYKGVEPFHMFGKTPEAFRRQVEDLGMTISSTHFPWTNRSDEISQVVEIVQTFGLTRAPGGFGPDDFADADALARTIEATQSMVDQLKPHGITLFLHNHWWEYNIINGRTAYHQLQDAVPEVEFEIDTYWAANFGNNDPAAELARVASRAPLAHIKDGPLVQDEAMVAVGSGKMDFDAIFAATDPQVFEWAVVELDHCDTDMLTAVAASYKYLTENGFAYGNV